MSSFTVIRCIVPALVFLGSPASVVGADKQTQNLRDDTSYRPSLDRQPGEVRFGDGDSGRRPVSGPNPKVSPGARLRAAPTQELPSELHIQRGTGYEEDEHKIRDRRQGRTQQRSDESVDDNVKDAKVQNKKAHRLIKEAQERQTETTRKTISSD